MEIFDELKIPCVYRAIPLETAHGYKFVYGSLVIMECCKTPFSKNNEENFLCFILSRKPDGIADWGLPYPTVHYTIDKETIDFFTGIFDKNGQPVFTSDYIQFDKNETIYKIYYNKELGIIEFVDLNNRVKGNFSENQFSNFIVVGNAYYD